MEPAEDQVLLLGSYSSALDTGSRKLPTKTALPPPVTRTLPLPSSVAVWETRAAAMRPAAHHVPVSWSYGSSHHSEPCLVVRPLAARTLPYPSTAALSPSP